MTDAEAKAIRDAGDKVRAERTAAQERANTQYKLDNPAVVDVIIPESDNAYIGRKLREHIAQKDKDRDAIAEDNAKQEAARIKAIEAASVKSTMAKMSSPCAECNHLTSENIQVRGVTKSCAYCGRAYRDHPSLARSYNI